MKSTIIRAAAVVAALTAISAAPMAAQNLSPINFNVRAGASMPTGDFGDGANTGFIVGAGIGFRPAILPVGLRFDGDYNRFGANSDVVDANYTVWALTANVVLAPALSPIYGIGGIGYYGMSVSGDGLPDSESETEMGFNVGAGFKLPLTGFNTFIEARYHSVSTEGDRLNFVPITFGIEF